MSRLKDHFKTRVHIHMFLKCCNKIPRLFRKLLAVLQGNKVVTCRVMFATREKCTPTATKSTSYRAPFQSPGFS